MSFVMGVDPAEQELSDAIDKWIESGAFEMKKKTFPGFVHLHGHSDHSVMDGIATIDEIVRRAKALDMGAIAITDHGNMSAALPFYLIAKQEGLVPIIGCEVYVAADTDDKSKERFHLVLLCKSLEGYHNLCRITTDAFINGFYYKPRTSLAKLAKWGKGLIALSACAGGEIPQAYMNGGLKEARAVLKRYKKVFGEDFYLELQFNELEMQKKINNGLIKLSQKTGVPLVITADYHYTEPNHNTVQDITVVLNTHKNNYIYDVRELFIKSSRDIRKAAKKWRNKLLTKEILDEAMSNTLKIADQCNIVEEMDEFLSHRRFPKFNIPDGYNKSEYLKKLARKGFKWRNDLGQIPKQQLKKYKARLRYEFDVICKMGFEDYFLIMADVIKWSREQGIFIGVGRGSAAGSLLSWVLGITNIDPVKHGLFFERFINIDRGDNPDIDSDFESGRRGEVIEYFRNKYGKDNVANIITFGTFGSRGVMRDLASYFKIAKFKVDKIIDQIPEGGVTLEEVAEEVGDKLIKLLHWVLEDREITPKEFLELAMKMQHQVRQFGTHAGGVVVANQPLVELLPLQKNKDVTVTAFDESPRFECLSKLGLIKFDILGLKTLDVIRETLDTIRDIHGVDMFNSIWNLPLDDETVFIESAKGNTVGTFQFQSEGIRDTLRTIRPDTFEDLVAANALHRPGTLKAGGVDTYAEQKKEGRENIKDPVKAKLLSDTYGTLVYQEQIIQMMVDVGGFTPPQADIARKKIIKLSSKGELDQELQKQRKGEMDAIFNKFADGAVERGYGRDWVDNIRHELEQFASYSFNKAHAASYAYIFYVCMYLKCHYPKEYMKSLLNWYEMSSRLRYIKEAKRLGVKVLPPNINTSQLTFTIEKEDIRFGIGEIKFVGQKAAKIIEERELNGPFKSILDFVERVGIKGRAVETLIDAGCFDSFGPRWEVKRLYNEKIVGYTIETVESKAKELYEKRQGKDLKSVPTDMGGIMDELSKGLFETRKISTVEKLLREKDAMGYYRKHPLALKTVKPFIKEQQAIFRKRVDELPNNSPVVIIGVIEEKGKKHNQRYFELSDPTGTITLFMSQKFQDDHGDYFELNDMDKGRIVIAGGIKTGSGSVKLKSDNELRWDKKNSGRQCQIFDVTNRVIKEGKSRG